VFLFYVDKIRIVTSSHLVLGIQRVSAGMFLVPALALVTYV